MWGACSTEDTYAHTQVSIQFLKEQGLTVASVEDGRRLSEQSLALIAHLVLRWQNGMRQITCPEI